MSIRMICVKSFTHGSFDIDRGFFFVSSSLSHAAPQGIKRSRANKINFSCQIKVNETEISFTV